MISEMELSAISQSLWIALAGLLLSLPPGIFLGWLLARRSFPGKTLLEILIFLPLVLPPVVTGYILLVLFGREGLLWAPFYESTGIEIIFSFRGMVLAAAVVSFPLLVRSIRAAIETVDIKLEETAQTLGSSRWNAFLRITIPLAWPGFIAGALLFYVRALGEFGATRMVALNTEGSRTIALEVFRLVETPGASGAAIVRLAFVSILLSGIALLFCEILSKRWRAASP